MPQFLVVTCLCFEGGIKVLNSPVPGRFEGGIKVLNAPVPGRYMLVTFNSFKVLTPSTMKIISASS